VHTSLESLRKLLAGKTVPVTIQIMNVSTANGYAVNIAGLSLVMTTEVPTVV
jgi:hypothetical protein